MGVTCTLANVAEPGVCVPGQARKHDLMLEDLARRAELRATREEQERKSDERVHEEQRLQIQQQQV